MHSEILIVGAGPVGLTLAGELARQGIPSRIVEAATGRVKQGAKALAIHPRSLEVLHGMGVLQDVLARGTRILAGNIYNGQRRLTHVDLESNETPFPFTAQVMQNDTEDVLEQHAMRLGIQIERATRCVGLEQPQGGPPAALLERNGQTERATASWIIGCDGAHSAVRHALGLPFEGKAFEENFLAADVTIAGMPGEQTHIFLTQGKGVATGTAAAVPAPGPSRFRLFFDLPADHPPVEPSLAGVHSLLAERGLTQLQVSDATWVGLFKINQRLVPRYRVGRVLLAGDACHIQSPIGGQGMNTGIQDANNLAWKLALVVRGLAPESLLDTYEIERRPVAAGILEGTGDVTKMATVRGGFKLFMRDRMIGMVGKLPPARRKLTRNLFQLGYDYTKSPLSVDDASGFSRPGPAPGMRVPAPELLNVTRPTVLAFAPSKNGADRVQQVVTAGHRFSDRIALYTVDPGHPLRASFGISGEAISVVRPDGFVAYRSGKLDPARLDAYLVRLFRN